MNKNRQGGMTGLGWLIVLALIGFFAVVAIRVTPMYLESFSVAGSVESLKNEPFVTQKSPAEIMSLLLRRFDVNDVESVDPKKDIKIERANGVLRVTVEYESRRPLMANLDVVGHFKEQVEIIAN